MVRDCVNWTTHTSIWLRRRMVFTFTTQVPPRALRFCTNKLKSMILDGQSSENGEYFSILTGWIKHAEKSRQGMKTPVIVLRSTWKLKSRNTPPEENRLLCGYNSVKFWTGVFFAQWHALRLRFNRWKPAFTGFSNQFPSKHSRFIWPWWAYRFYRARDQRQLQSRTSSRAENLEVQTAFYSWHLFRAIGPDLTFASLSWNTLQAQDMNAAYTIQPIHSSRAMNLSA